MKFSVIVPIYNVEKYLKECLNSIKNQTYENFEVIMVNDGSLDNSKLIAESFLNDKKFKLYNRKNNGLSDARNFGVSKVIGEYIIFVDSDDSIEKELLERLNDEIDLNGKAEVIRYGNSIICNERKIETKYPIFSFINSSEAFKKLLEGELIEVACVYAFNSEFYKSNSFKFEVGKSHEDFGLIPYILIKSNKISSIDYCGYNYIKRDNSITTTKDQTKILKKVYDVLYFYDKLNKSVNLENKISDETKKVFKSFISNAVINKSKELSGYELKKYISELETRKLYKNINSKGLMRKIKVLIIKYNLNFYIKHFVKRGKE